MKQVDGIPLTLRAYEFFSPITVFSHFEFLYIFSPALSLLIVLEKQLCIDQKSQCEALWSSTLDHILMLF